MPDQDTSVQFILASASPRRQELLHQMGLRFQVSPVDVDESIQPGEKPAEAVLRLARLKTRQCLAFNMKQGTDLPVLGSDTVVELDQEILGKPVNEADAEAMLQRLSGRIHHVHTAVVVATPDAEYSAVSSSQVDIAVLSASMIKAYVETGEPMDKAGAYAIQGLAAQFIKSLQGSYSGVMGLPLFETASLLAQCGINTMPYHQ